MILIFQIYRYKSFTNQKNLTNSTQAILSKNTSKQIYYY